MAQRKREAHLYVEVGDERFRKLKLLILMEGQRRKKNLSLREYVNEVIDEKIDNQVKKGAQNG